jgi:GNAT superfamily N-acetyltransferase
MERMILRPYADPDEPAARRIYEDSFPESLRAPWAEVRDHRADEELLVLVEQTEARDMTDAQHVIVQGIVLLRHLGDTGLTFVRYLAVDNRHRNRGIGGQLVDALRTRLSEGGRAALLLDVEAPHGDHADMDRRRITFYQRHGLQLLDAPDYAPPEHGASGERVPLLLMGCNLDGADHVSGDSLPSTVAAVLLHRYGVTPD